VTRSRASSLPATIVTRVAIRAIVIIISATAMFVMARYASLPWLLPVHFRSNGAPNGWQYRTPARVLLPVFVQIVLALLFGGISALLLSRRHGDLDADAPDVKAAGVAAEAVALIALVWVAFQAYAALALVSMWASGRSGLGAGYGYFEVAGAAATLLVAVRAHVRLGRPLPRPFVAEHWRYGQLYRNAADPALFVPTRDGRRWTLNFGRPVAAALLALILAVGIVAPTVILGLLLRTR
jgi:uncharacterized membrane protein